MLSLFIPWILALLVAVTILLLITKRWKIGLFFLLVVAVTNFWSKCVPFRLWPVSENYEGSIL